MDDKEEERDIRQSFYVSIRDDAINFREATGMLTENTIFLTSSLSLYRPRYLSNAVIYSSFFILSTCPVLRDEILLYPNLGNRVGDFDSTINRRVT